MDKNDFNSPVRTEPFPPWPKFDDDEVEKIAQVLRSGKVNYWTGEEGKLFEQEFAEFCHCNYAVALANGTVALELALKVLNIGQGDEVIVPSKTFIASASAVALQGATPVLADVDRDSQNLTVDSIKEVLTPRTKAIIAVHLSGWPCDMYPIMELAKENNLKVIEDCAQAHGATYHGKPIGSFGDMAAFSFCQDKILSTGGEGGMLLTNDKYLWEKAWSFKDHGKNYALSHDKTNKSTLFRWLHDSFGTNWRMTEMQSAIGRIQLRKLNTWVDIRRKHASILNERLQKISALRVPIPAPEFKHAFYKYYAFLRLDKLKEDWTREKIISSVFQLGIPCFSGHCSELYLEKAFTSQGLGPKKPLAIASELAKTSLMFQVHPTLTEKEILDTCLAVEKVFDSAQK